uniref:Uncharacterized protein n=1 Tax=Pundamilia nyererei TaxID=303518 RepID=A0A3B4FTM2_9CICH
MSRMVPCCWFLFVITGTEFCMKTCYFVESCQHEPQLRNVSAVVCSDSAASMTGRDHGVIRQIFDRASEAKWTHCFLHRESLQQKRCHQTSTR